MMDKRTCTHVDQRSSKDLRGPVLGLLLLRKCERVSLLTREVYTVGSDRTCDIVVKDDPHVSARHCTIERRGESLLVFDDGSKNGTWINDVRTSFSELGVRARLRVGDTVFLAYGPGIQDDDHPTPSQDTFVRGQIADYGGNATRAAKGLGVQPRTAQRKKRELMLPLAAPPESQRVTLFDDSIPVAIAEDVEVVVTRRGGRRRLHCSPHGVRILKLDGGK